MRQNMSSKQRKALATKMSRVFEEDVKMLSKEMQETLMDDLITAFLSRLEVLSHVRNSESKSSLAIEFPSDSLELIHSHS